MTAMSNIQNPRKAACAGSELGRKKASFVGFLRSILKSECVSSPKKKARNYVS